MTAKTETEALANFIMAEVPGEPSKSEGAGETAIRIIRDLQSRLEPFEQRAAGNEFCESHEDWLPIEDMQMDSEGVWLCQEAWDELVASQ